MKKKKFLAMLLACVMTLAVVTGCSNKSETTPADNATAGEDASSNGGAYKIALIQQHQTNAFQIAVTEAA